MIKVHVNKQYALQARDFIKSWYLAAGVPLGTLIYQYIEAWSKNVPFDANWKLVLVNTSIATGLFLIERYFQKPKVITIQESNEKARSVALKIENEPKFTVMPYLSHSDVVDKDGYIVFTGTNIQCLNWVQNQAKKS